MICILGSEASCLMDQVGAKGEVQDWSQLAASLLPHPMPARLGQGILSCGGYDTNSGQGPGFHAMSVFCHKPRTAVPQHSSGGFLSHS